MQQTLMILSETEEINSLLYKPIIATQRIKYTCLNVSANYIVLGSSSGSLYLFTREPCTFQQLMPLSEGPVSCVAISPDEKTIALATKRGSVCLVAVRPTVKLLNVSNEHLGELVTAICWNANSSDIYVGDGIGKISTMSLSTFTVNGIFQPQSCALMHLDSTIVQMTFSSKLLLISTMTRSYICDTTQEHFKQIGNKSRDGEFGACFLDKPSSHFLDDRSIVRSAITDEKKNSTLKNTSIFTSDTTNNDVTGDRLSTTIYCSRPGCRLWEVTETGIVVKTHQFKETLAIPPANVYRLNSTRASVNRQNIKQTNPQIHNFSHLHVLAGKYLFTHTTTGIYIIDPTNAIVVLWNNDYIGIDIARTIDDKIYLMTNSGIFHCLTISTVDDLIVQLYEKKCYNESLRACQTLRPDLLRKIGYSEQSLQRNDEMIDNSDNFVNNEIAGTLVSLITLIQSNLNVKPIKLTSGIVVVNSGNGKIGRNEDFTNLRDRENFFIDDGNNFCENKKIIDDDDDVDGLLTNDHDPVISDDAAKKKLRLKNDEIVTSNHKEDSTNFRPKIVENFVGIVDEKSVDSEDNIDRVTMNIQTDLNPIYMMINNLKPSLNDEETKEIITEVKKKLKEIDDNYGKIVELKDFLWEILRSTERHYYNVILENTRNEVFLNVENEFLIDEIFRAFGDVNSSSVIECECGFTCSNCWKYENSIEPKFYEIGKSLLRRYFDENKKKCVNLCKRVPFMWRDYSSMLMVDRKSFDDHSLRLCLGTRDNFVLATILPRLDVERWTIVVNFVRNVEGGSCPNCGERMENLEGEKFVIDWNGIGREILKRDGSTAATEFLILVDEIVPDVRLDRSLFQSLIFTKILEHHGLKHAVEFDRNGRGTNEYEAMCSPKIQDELVETLEKDLKLSIGGNVFGIGSHHWGMRFQSKSSTCPCCTLSLQTPVLLGTNGISLFPCGHAYHVSCLIQRKLTRCNLHGRPD